MRHMRRTQILEPSSPLSSFSCTIHVLGVWVDYPPFLSYHSTSRLGILHNSAIPAAAKPKSSTPMAAVCLGAQAALAVLPVVAVPVLVAVELAVPVVTVLPLVAVPVPDAPAAVLVQLTTEGTVTPWAEQIWEAKVMAEDWSAWSQSPTRQQATLERKSWLEQMHLASVPQPL